MRRKIIWIAVIVLFAFQFLLVVIVWWQNRPVTHCPLPLKQVTWELPSDLSLAVVDLDANGKDDLLMVDQKGHLWWSEWTGEPPRFEPIPVSHLISFTISSQIIVAKTGKSECLITRSGNQWHKQIVTALNARVDDLDGDGQNNDVLLLTTPKTLEWWQRTKDGKFLRRDQLTLPKHYNSMVVGIVVGGGYEVWNRLSLHGLNSQGFVCLENMRLRWKGAFVNNLMWKDADLDGDGKADHLEFWRWRDNRCELVINFANGKCQVLKLPSLFYGPPFITDVDGDRRAEILFMEGPHESLRLRLFRFDLKRQKFLEWVSPTINVMLVGEELFYSLLQQNNPNWSLLLTVKRGNYWQVERWWVSEKGWQSELVTVLPKVVSSKGDGVMEGWSVYQIGKVLLLVERREHPKWRRKFQDLFRDLCFKIGLNVAFGEYQIPHRRLWVWDEKKHRWLVLGYALPEIARDDVFREWVDLVKLGSNEEFAILWWSSYSTAHIGRFHNSVWQTINLNVPLQFPINLWDGERYWAIFCYEPIDIDVKGKRWIAVTLPSHSNEDEF